MNFDVDETWESRDAVSANLTISGTVDQVVNDSIEWDTIPTFSPSFMTDAHQSFFGTDDFYQFDATIAKSIPQTYVIGDDEYTFLKPGDSLKQAVFSVDNSPFVIEHPPIGRVTQTKEIHGVFHDSYFDRLTKSINSTVSVPATDDEALSYLSNNDNISIGFYNNLRESERTDIDAEQSNIYVDHVAAVERGRCSDEDGCQIRV